LEFWRKEYQIGEPSDRPVEILYKNALSYQPTTAQQCRSETGKNIFQDLFSSVLSQFRKYQPSGNLKLNNLGIF